MRSVVVFFFFLWLGSAIVGGVFGIDISGDWLDFSWVFLGLIWLRWAKFFWVCKGGDGGVFWLLRQRLIMGIFFFFFFC